MGLVDDGEGSRRKAVEEGGTRVWAELERVAGNLGGSVEVVECWVAGGVKGEEK